MADALCHYHNLHNIFFYRTRKSICSGCSISFPVTAETLVLSDVAIQKTAICHQEKPGCIWLHLNPWVSTRQLGVREISQFWFSLITTLKSSLAQSSQPIIMSSHLLGSKRIAKLRLHFPVKRYRFHFIKRPIGRAEHIGLQLEILIKEWRRFTPSLKAALW